jgi:hypothetical protein
MTLTGVDEVKMVASGRSCYWVHMVTPNPRRMAVESLAAWHQVGSMEDRRCSSGTWSAQARGCPFNWLIQPSISVGPCACCGAPDALGDGLTVCTRLKLNGVLISIIGPSVKSPPYRYCRNNSSPVGGEVSADTCIGAKFCSQLSTEELVRSSLTAVRRDPLVPVASASAK